MLKKALVHIVFINLCLSANYKQVEKKLITADISLFDIQKLKTHRSIEDEIEELKKEPYIAISLGHNCPIALNLRAFNLRVRSFPFDWNVTPVPALCSLINNHF